MASGSKKGLLGNIIDKAVGRIPFAKGKAKGLVNGATDTVKKVVKLKVKITIISIIAIVLIIAISTWAIVSSLTDMSNIIAIVTEALGIVDKDAQTEEQAEQPEDADEYPIYGVYPIDDALRVKQEMMEICDNAGKLYGIPGKFVMGILTVESASLFENIPLEREGGSLYTDLVMAYTNDPSQVPYFVDGANTGKYTDDNGTQVIDPIKVGMLNPKASGAIGTFQFLDKYIESRFTSIYVGQNGNVTKEDNIAMMSKFDSQLGFMRPNPFYFPDAALNCAKFLSGLMDAHKDYVNELKSLGMTEEVIQEILFIYGADRYHGDLKATGKGQDADNVHDSMGELYADVYLKYSQSMGITSLGDFSKGGYSSASVRAVVAGSQFGGSVVDFDGTFNHNVHNEVKTDSTGKYVELSGTKFYKPFVTEFANTPRFNKDYKRYITNMSAHGGNKFGLVYGFQALNCVTYMWNTWAEQIAAAPKEQIGGTRIYADGIPYAIDSKSREEMLTAGMALVGKVRYIYGGGHFGTGDIKAINPLWRRFNQIYLDSRRGEYSIHPYKSYFWCPIHTVNRSTNSKAYCAYYGPSYTNAATFLKGRATEYAEFGGIYSDITEQQLSSMFRANVSGLAAHYVEGLDCSGFTAWMYNQVIPDQYFTGSADDFINTNKLERIPSKNKSGAYSKLLPCDTITSSGHVFTIVGAVSSTSNAYVMIESTPPEVRFGVTYTSNASTADIRKAMDIAGKANEEFGGITGHFSSYNLAGLSIGRYTGFTDRGFESKTAEEIINYIKPKLASGFMGR